MFLINVLNLFLYFPEDKSEYWSAGITSLIFLIACILTMKFIIAHSKKELKKAQELEEKLKNEQ